MNGVHVRYIEALHHILTWLSPDRSVSIDRNGFAWSVKWAHAGAAHRMGRSTNFFADAPVMHPSHVQQIFRAARIGSIKGYCSTAPWPLLKLQSRPFGWTRLRPSYH